MEKINTIINKPIGLDAVVGGASKSDKEKLFKSISESFTEGRVNKTLSLELLKLETEKTKEDLDIIMEANVLTSSYRKKFRDDIFDMPINNIHILDREKTKEFFGILGKSKLEAFFDLKDQSIFIPREQNPTIFLSTLIHEMNHLKSHNKLILHKRPLLALFKKLEGEQYRSGVMLLDKKTKNFGFRNLNEAITETITTKMMWEKVGSSFKKEELNVIDWFSKRTNLRHENFFGLDVDKFRKGEENFLPKFSYSYQMEAYYLLIKKISEKNHLSENEVENSFEESYFTGKLNKLAHLIENTYGKGSFRSMANIDTNTKNFETLKNFINSI